MKKSHPGEQKEFLLYSIFRKVSQRTICQRDCPGTCPPVNTVGRITETMTREVGSIVVKMIEGVLLIV